MNAQATAPTIDEVVENTAQRRTIHVRHDGRSHDVDMDQLDVGERSTNQEVFAALARHLDVPVTKFANHAVDRMENGNMTVRPEAVFG